RRIEIDQPEPEYVLLQRGPDVEPETPAEHAAAAGGVDEPAADRLALRAVHSLRQHPVRALDDFDVDDAVFELRDASGGVAGAQVPVEGEAVHFEGGERRQGRRLIDDVAAVRRVLELLLVIISEAVFGMVPLDQKRPQPELADEKRADLDQGFADDRPARRIAADDRDAEIGEGLAEIGGREIGGDAVSQNADLGHLPSPSLSPARPARPGRQRPPAIAAPPMSAAASTSAKIGRAH